MSTESRTGTVTEFDEHVGLGKVQTEDGDSYLFHCTQIADGSRSIEIGAVVSFAVVPSHKGTYEAANVQSLLV